jgi:kumamolisin
LTAERFVVEGSDRTLIAGSVFERALSPDELVSVTLRLHSRAGDLRVRANEMAVLPLRDRKYVAREDADKEMGANPEDVNAILAIAKENGIEASVSPISGRTIDVRIPAGRVKEIFGTDLGVYILPNQTTYRGRDGAISLPPILPIETGRSIQGVFGLDSRRQAWPSISQLEELAIFVTNMFPASYDFPSDLDGKGQCIGILEFGNAYSRERIGTYYGVDTSNIQTLTLDNIQISEPVGDWFSLEVGLDLAIASQIAKNANIVFYFAPSTEQGWVDSLDAAVHDTVNRPGVLSISFGCREAKWTQNGIDAVDELLAEAAILGLTVCAASGDHGADLDLSNHPRVMLPASSSYALACGGTMLTRQKQDQRECTWNDAHGASGGGISERIPRPKWQPPLIPATIGNLPKVNNDGRLLPDVAAIAHGLYAAVGGSNPPVNGTSAAAPLWAALLACANQKLQGLGKNTVGHITPLLYQPSFSGVCTDVLCGNNGSPGYAAGPNWDACTGWGSPIGSELVSALLQSASAKLSVVRKEDE